MIRKTIGFSTAPVVQPSSTSTLRSRLAGLELRDQIAETIGNGLLDDGIVHRPQMEAEALLGMLAERAPDISPTISPRPGPTARTAGLPVLIHALDPLRAEGTGTRRSWALYRLGDPRHGCCCNAVVNGRFQPEGTKAQVRRYGVGRLAKPWQRISDSGSRASNLAG